MTAEPSSSERHFAASRWIRAFNALSTASALAAATSVVGTLFLPTSAASAASALPAYRAAVAGTFAFGVVAALATRSLSPLSAKLASTGAMVVAVAITAVFTLRPVELDVLTVFLSVVTSGFAWGPGLLLVWYAFGRPLDAARKAARFPTTLTASDSAERRVADVGAMYAAVTLWLATLQQLLMRGHAARHGLTFFCALLALAASAVAWALLGRRRTFLRSFLARVRAGTERDYRLSRDARGREVLTRLQRLPDGSTGGGYRLADRDEEAIGIVDASEDAGSPARLGHFS